MREQFSRWFGYVTHPQASYKKIQKQSVEDFIGEYMKMVLLTGVLAGLSVFVREAVNAIYLWIVRGISISVGRFLNYHAGISVGTFFAWLFIATIGVCLVVVFTRFFSYQRLPDRFVRVCFSAAPILVFGWIAPPIALALVLWSITLYVSNA